MRVTGETIRVREGGKGAVGRSYSKGTEEQKGPGEQARLEGVKQ